MLHDIDANKPSGSIKIRVKTYVHALKLHEERLQDFSSRKRELELAIDKKRLALLELREDQMRARSEKDPAVEAQIQSIREKISTYEWIKNAKAKEELPEGVIQLGRKTEHGVRAIKMQETPPSPSAE